MNIKKDELETSSNLSLEQLKKNNPKLYNHVLRALKIEKQHLELKEELLRMKEEKKELQLQYYRITKAFAGEEKTKQKMKETEGVVEEKGKYVAELTKQLSEIQQRLHTAKLNMHNVELKKTLMEYNEVKARKERLVASNAGIEEEIRRTEENTEKLEKNPEKVTPSAANTNLRKEIKALEAQVIESSRKIKDKEKEKFQAEFNYEEACKQLKELQKPIEIITRNSLSRRVSIREGSSVISPTSPTKRFNDSRADALSPDKVASRKSVVIVEHVASPEKRASIVNMVSKGMTETLTEQLDRALKKVGKPGQGIASKLLSVNRGNIIAKAK
jgi:chromosome segregation ATPase